MAQIKSKNTKPEEVVRKFLFSKGLRYRKNDKRYFGKPDIVFPKYKAIIFVNGCFWHCHDGCKEFVVPKSHLDYWLPKLERNRKRDEETYYNLQVQGWRVIVVWECELKKGNRESRLNALYDELVNN